MRKTDKNRFKILFLGGIILIVILLIVSSIWIKKDDITFIDINNTESYSNTEIQSSNTLKLRYSDEYRSWKSTSDTTFKSLYNGNQAIDVLAARPNMVILWAGYAFSKSYLSPRGHMYAVDDLHHSLRTGAPTCKEDGPQSASCWACKSPDVSPLIEKIGLQAFYQKKWSFWGSEVVNPVGCADCHDQENMDLRISRPFLTEAYERQGYKVENASDQDMRSLVCAQCHSEYYLKGENKEIVLPWDFGYTVENIEAYYDRIGFSDFTHKLSRTPILKAQHPDYELAQLGIHAQRGVSCDECHMPYIGEETKKYNNHHIQSPLAMIDRTCQSCHRQNEETLRQNVYLRQNNAITVRNRLEEELSKAHIEAKFAWDNGATEKQMEEVLRLLRQAQWRWDFGIASHGASFHAPQEVQRILGDGLDKTMQARILIMKVLTKLGYSTEVPMPDISTKEKAQKYIGLDMHAESATKEQFLKTVLPEWIQEAKDNHRLIEDN